MSSIVSCFIYPECSQDLDKYSLLSSYYCPLDDGKLYTMGETDGGKLGLPDDVEDTHTPQHVTSVLEPVKSVACGSSHTIALTGSAILFNTLVYLALKYVLVYFGAIFLIMKLN